MSNEIANLKSRDGTKNLYPVTKTECVYDSNNQNLDNLLGGKQTTLVSGVNIKTINNQSILGSGNINIQGGGGSGTDVQIDSTSITNNGVANILTKNSNYNSSTNKLVTESDLSGYVESNTQIQGESTIYNQIGPYQDLGGIILTSGDDVISGEPTKISGVLVTPDLVLTQSNDTGVSAVSQVTARTGTDMYSAETSENNTDSTLSLNIQKEASALDIQLSAQVTDTQTHDTTTQSSAIHASATELDLDFPLIVPVNTNTTDLGSSLSKFKDLYLAGKLQADGGLTDGNNANYELHLPDTTSWTADKTIATVDQVDAKQNVLTFDSAPTQNSTNPVTSGGVYTALSGKANDNAVVKLTGNQTVAGTKTFSSPIRGSLQYNDSGGEYANLISGNGTDININEGDYEGIQDVNIWGKNLFFNDNCIGDIYHKLSTPKSATTTSASTTTWNVSDIIPSTDYVSGAVYELYGQWHMYKTDVAFGYIWTDLWGNSTSSSGAVLNTTGASRVAQTAFTIPASASSAINFKRSASVSESYIYIFGYRRIK